MERPNLSLRGVCIYDLGPERVLAFDLHDLLTVGGNLARELSWQCSNVECIGDAAHDLHALSDSGRSISGDALMEIARRLLQTIDGDFRGYSAAGALTLHLRAVDST
jgi:hypothetical protein